MIDFSIYKGKVIDVDTTNNKVKVSVPTVHGGSVAPDRILDSELPWMKSIVSFSNQDINKVVIVAFEGGSHNSPIVLGKLW